jgi:hypothetical protein
VATETKQSTTVIVQSVLPPELAEQLKAQAELERRSVSQTIRLALEDRLRGAQERRPRVRSGSPSPIRSSRSTRSLMFTTRFARARSLMPESANSRMQSLSRH